MKPNKFISGFFSIVHSLLILSLFYFALFAKPDETYMAVAIVSFIYLTWGIFGGKCLITELENDFREDNDKSEFVVKIFRDVFGSTLESERVIDIIFHSYFMVLALIAVLRLRYWANNKK